MTNKAYTGKVDFGFVYFYIYYTYYSKNSFWEQFY